MPQRDSIQQAIQAGAGGVTLRVKVVPGASRSRVVGMLGDRLKLSVAAPPEQGKANKAVCQLIAKALGVSRRDVSVTAGQTQPNKTLSVVGLGASEALDKLALLVDL